MMPQNYATSTGDVQWPSSAATSTLTISASTNATASTWIVWSSSYVNTTTSTTSITGSWDAWSSNVYPMQPSCTPEQLAARAAQQELARQRHAIDRARREVAVVRADKLLASILSEVQRAHVEAHGYFLVRGRSGQLYRIRRGWSGNVDVLSPAGEVLDRLCAHPATECPIGDNMAAQKLMLESADEELFRKVARSHGRGMAQRVPSELLQAMASS